ncbi:MAG: family 16 glycoside hydrolase [Planctomycetota bacterium]
MRASESTRAGRGRKVGSGRGAGAAAVLALLAGALRAAGSAPELERHEYRRVVMGSQARIVLYAESEEIARTAAAAAFQRMIELDDLLTDYRPSELTRLGDAAGGRPVAASPDLVRILLLSREVSAASEGAFDVTVGPLTKPWREAMRTGVLPAPAVIEAARACVGWPDVEIDAEAGTVRLARPGMRLDLGAIGKGYAGDAALAVLEAHGVTRALVDVGGGIVLGDPPPDHTGWSVAVRTGAEGAEPVLVLAGEAVATSGDIEQHVVVDGVRYSHILDPRTGRGLTGSECVTVIAPTGALADALATAVSVRGIAASEALLARFGARVPPESSPPTLRAGEGGWIELFDGASLAGWTPRGGRYDGEAAWTVEDGAITGRVGPGGAGGLLYTEGEHTSFELEGEVRLDAPFDSGLFFRMVPPEGGKGFQVTLDDRPDGEIGGIYSDGWLEHCAAGRAAWRPNDWNRLRVRCTGFDPRIEVWLNGAAVTDFALPAGTGGFAPRGRIGVQVHGDRDDPPENAARFRRLRLRELPLFGAELFAPVSREHPEILQLTPRAREAGWKPLFDGQSRAGWQSAGQPDRFRVEEGEIRISSLGPDGYLATIADYDDFRLRLDFRVPRAGNSGVFLRAARDGSNPATSGCEVQILDDLHWEEETGSRLEPWQLAGSLYGALPPGNRGALHAPGEWNTLEILCQGARLAAALNGIPLYDVDTAALVPVLGPPFARRARSGFIGLQAHSSPRAAPNESVCFRNIFLQEL